jgi:hypothetical protein
VNTDLSLSFLPESIDQSKRDEVGVDNKVQDNIEEEIPKNQEAIGEIRIESSGFNQSDLLTKISDPTTKDADTESKHNSEEEVEVDLAKEVAEKDQKTMNIYFAHQDLPDESGLLLSRSEIQLHETDEAVNQNPANLDGTSSEQIIQRPSEEGMPPEEVEVQDLYQDLVNPSSSVIEPVLQQPEELEDGELSDESVDSEGKLYIDDTKEV